MLAQKNRLSKKKDFSAVFTKGQSRFGRLLGVKIKPNNTNPFVRCGIIVSNKISKKAVERNLIKRRLRAIIYGLIQKKFFETTCDVVIITLPAIKSAEFIEINKELNFLLKTCLKKSY